MKIIKVNPKNPHKETIEEAAEIIRQGGVIVYPTDTCYGLGADISNIFALEKIYRIKGRDSRKPLSIIVKNISYIEKIALVEAQSKEILKKYLPGPYTFIMLNLDYQHFKYPSIAIRIPQYKITQMISEKFHLPYATTSANISGLAPCYNVAEIIQQFKKNKFMPDLILDAGALPNVLPSTIVDLTKKTPQIMRVGAGEFELN